MIAVIRFAGDVEFLQVRGLPPGIKRVALVRAAVDSDGHEWPAGAEFTPSSAGYDNLRGGMYRDVVPVTRQEVAS